MLFKSNAFIVLLLGRFLQIFITLCSLRISTTILPQSELGAVYYIIAIQSFFTLFLISPVGQYFNRQTSKWFVDGVIYSAYRKQFQYILFVTLLSIFAMASIVFAGVTLLTYPLLLITSALILTQSINQTLIPMINMLEKRVAFVVFNLLTAFISILSSYLLIVFYSASALSWVAGIILGNGIVTFIATIWFKKRNQIVTNKKIKLKFDELCKFSVPIAIATAFMWFLSSGYRITVEAFYGLNFIAFLGVGLSVSSQVFTITESLLTQYLIPGLFKNVENANKEKRQKLINNYLATVVPLYVSLALFLTFSVQYLFPFVVGEQYYSAYNFAIYGAWIELSRVLTNAFSIVSQVEKKTMKFIMPYMLGAMLLFVTLLLNNVLKLDGQVQSLLFISNFVVFLVMYFSMKKYLLFKIPFKEIFVTSLMVLPSILYFILVDFHTSLSVEHFFMYLCGGIIYLTCSSFAFVALYKKRSV